MCGCSILVLQTQQLSRKWAGYEERRWKSKESYKTQTSVEVIKLKKKLKIDIEMDSTSMHAKRKFYIKIILFQIRVKI